MPSRSRPDRHRDRPSPVTPAGGGEAAPAPGAPDDVRRFAELLRAQQAREKATAAAARELAGEERRRLEREASDARQLDDARAAKERAAKRLKDVRAQRASNAAVAEAEAGYKQALADLLAIESGERPSWAPAPAEPPTPEAQADEVADPVADSGDDAEHQDAATDPG